MRLRLFGCVELGFDRRQPVHICEYNRVCHGTQMVRGRPPIGVAAKRQVTLRLDPEGIGRFRADGPDWQGRINAALRKAAGL